MSAAARARHHPAPPTPHPAAPAGQPSAQPPTHRATTHPVTAAPEKRLLSVEETAECMSIGRDAVYELIRTGALRSITIGSRRLISVAAIDAYIAQREAEQAGEGASQVRSQG